jgi:hypothetical protein
LTTQWFPDKISYALQPCRNGYKPAKQA